MKVSLSKGIKPLLARYEGDEIELRRESLIGTMTFGDSMASFAFRTHRHAPTTTAVANNAVTPPAVPPTIPPIENSGGQDGVVVLVVVVVVVLVVVVVVIFTHVSAWLPALRLHT